jgi:hypothetical protein
MDDTKKAKIKSIMFDYLKTKGWPNCENPDEVVLQNLEPMFQLLIKENLVSYNDYDSYLMAAEFSYIISR